MANDTEYAEVVGVVRITKEDRHVVVDLGLLANKDNTATLTAAF